jgi:hypothetical protein
MSKLPNNNGLLLFNKTVKEVKIEFKKQGRTEKWSEIQKWTSKNVFQQVKHKSHKKITKEDILSITLVELHKQKPVPTQSDCESVTTVPVGDRICGWFDLYEQIQMMPYNVLMRVNTGHLGKSRIDFRGNFTESDIKEFVFTTEVRELSNNTSGSAFEGIDKVMPNKKDDGKPCSYFIDWVLTYTDGTLTDTSSGVDVDAQWTAELEEEREKRNELLKQKKKENLIIQKRKKAERPRTKKGESETKPTGKPTGKPTEKTTGKPTTPERPDLIRALELLKEDFKDGIFTKEEYKEERKLIISKFEKGGTV